MKTLCWLTFLSCLLSLTPLAQALTKREVLVILAENTLRPSTSEDPLSILMTSAPLATGIIEPQAGTTPEIDVAQVSGNPQWFAFVDLEPGAFFEHDVLYVFIDDVTGEINSLPALDWPLIDGVPMEDDVSPGGKLIRIFPLLACPEPVMAEANALAPMADFGDAPDGQEAYPSVTGKFPTLWQTTNSRNGSPGAHALMTGMEMLGTTVSAEQDARDPADVDGMPNLLDADKDDRAFIAWDPSASPATGNVIYDVTVAPGAPDIDRYANFVIDFNQDGTWENVSEHTEWAVVNDLVSVTPGTTETQVSTAFNWTGAGLPAPLWSRLVLSRQSIVPQIHGDQGWDGSGLFTHGEVEDYRICSETGGPPPPPPPPPPPESDPPKERFDWFVPTQLYALVVQGIDKPEGRPAARQAADAMERAFITQGYETSRLNGNGKGMNQATKESICAWITEVKSKVKCQDQIMIYFVAHGAKDTPGGSMHLGPGKSDTYTGDDLKELLDKIDSCDEEGCDTGGKCCDVNVILESCYSGQFLDDPTPEDPSDDLDKDGRQIITTSSSTQPSYFGSSGSGGEYSNRYIECTDGSVSDQVDGDGDGIVAVSEVHNWATGRLKTPKPQTPQASSNVCECECPPWIWDCLCVPDEGHFISFGPGFWFAENVLLGQTFDGEIQPLPEGVPVYDHLEAEVVADGWLWNVLVDDLQMQVNVQNIPPDGLIEISLFTVDPVILPELEPPLLFQINLQADEFQIQNRNGQIIAQGSWSEYPLALEETPFIPLQAYRSNLQPEPELEVEGFFLGGPDGAFAMQWNPLPNAAEYILDFNPGLDATGWNPIATLSNTAYVQPTASLLRGFFRVRRAPPNGGVGVPEP